MVEMFVFLAIFVIFLVGYGVATQALLYPDQSFSWRAVKNIFYMPYFQIYGELFLEVIVKGKHIFILVVYKLDSYSNECKAFFHRYLACAFLFLRS